MEAVAKEFKRNNYGILIVKCCASCVNAHSKGDDKRYCSLGGRAHNSDYYCGKHWVMKEGLKNAGKGGGKVKKKQYFDYINKYGIHHEEDYIRQYGSKYLTKR